MDEEVKTVFFPEQVVFDNRNDRWVVLAQCRDIVFVRDYRHLRDPRLFYASDLNKDSKYDRGISEDD